MICGTGKTFTALKTPTHAADNGGSAGFCLLVPSISLLSQTLREWTAARVSWMCSSVCSGHCCVALAEDYHVKRLTKTNQDLRCA